jgi:drug/metabolite transporter (DMT)-like permease
MLFSSLAMLFAAAGVLLHALLQPEPVVLAGWPVELYQLATLLTVITTILPPYLMSAGIQRMGAGNAAILGSIGPVSTLVLAWWFLGERLSGVQLAGAAIVLLGVGLVSYAGRNRKKAS